MGRTGAGLKRPYPHGALIQGDVGSGKTILAFLAMIMTAENGYQSALMVPTEVLARQHYESLCTLLKENNLTGYNPRLLTGSTKAKERREIYASLEDGSCKMVIGTHALIQERYSTKIWRLSSQTNSTASVSGRERHLLKKGNRRMFSL